MTYNVRRLQDNDREAWGKLWKGYQEFYQVDLNETTESTWQRLLASNENLNSDGPHGFVAEDENGNLLGLTHFLYHGTSWSPEPRCYLNDLFTDKKARGKGIGRMLILAVEKEAKQHGCSQTYWMTQDFNADARKLYDKVAMVTPFIKYQM